MPNSIVPTGGRPFKTSYKISYKCLDWTLINLNPFPTKIKTPEPISVYTPTMRQALGHHKLRLIQAQGKDQSGVILYELPIERLSSEPRKGGFYVIFISISIRFHIHQYKIWVLPVLPGYLNTFGHPLLPPSTRSWAFLARRSESDLVNLASWP